MTDKSQRVRLMKDFSGDTGSGASRKHHVYPAGTEGRVLSGEHSARGKSYFAVVFDAVDDEGWFCIIGEEVELLT